mmetsp:Transcript_28418/g.68418  ORF Transcript_28418/g.68418 Transcript_28418/m.68418 type:complete len:108 (+) Transcript_28418:468-791(+)
MDKLTPSPILMPTNFPTKRCNMTQHRDAMLSLLFNVLFYSPQNIPRSNPQEFFWQKRHLGLVFAKVRWHFISHPSMQWPVKVNMILHPCHQDTGCNAEREISDQNKS